VSRAELDAFRETPPLLWHILLSHYNEKVRWALDYKGIPHRRKVLGADYLARARWATGHGTLPILFLDGRAIGDSTDIIAALEARYPAPPLHPSDAGERARALALEDWLDKRLGPALRAAVVTPLFRNDPDVALRVLTTGMPDRAYRMLQPLVRIFPSFYRFRHDISDAKLETDRATVRSALDRIEQERNGRAYLVGDAFTVADLTAAASTACTAAAPRSCRGDRRATRSCGRDGHGQHFDHVTVVVRDMEAAKRFFAALGFEHERTAVITGDVFARYMGVPGIEAEHATLVLAAATPRTEVQLLGYRSPAPRPNPAVEDLHTIGFNHVCFAVDDLDAEVKRLRAAGVETRTDVLDFRGRKLVFLRGPEGITVELSELHGG
jgi:glutathione S-transferase